MIPFFSAVRIKVQPAPVQTAVRTQVDRLIQSRKIRGADNRLIALRIGLQIKGLISNDPVSGQTMQAFAFTQCCQKRNGVGIAGQALVVISAGHHIIYPAHQSRDQFSVISVRRNIAAGIDVTSADSKHQVVFSPGLQLIGKTLHIRLMFNKTVNIIGVDNGNYFVIFLGRGCVFPLVPAGLGCGSITGNVEGSRENCE